MIIQNSTDIKTEYFLDKNGDPSPIDVQYEKHNINPNGLVQLRNIPSIHTVFNITTKNGINVIKYNKVDKIVNQTDFTVDYPNGLLTFHSSQISKEIQVSYTNAIGRLSISSDRIFTKIDNQGNIVQTLNTLIEEGMEVLSNLETIGGANKIINELKGYVESVKGLSTTIIEGSNTNNNLKKTDETAKTTNSTLNSTITNADGKIQEMTEWVNKNGDVVNLNNRVGIAEGKLNTVSASLEQKAQNIKYIYSKIKADGITNDMPTLINEINSLKEYECLVTPKGVSVLSSAGNPNIKTNISLDFSATTFKKGSLSDTLIFKLNNSEVKGLTIDGNRDNQVFDDSKFGTDYLFKIDDNCKNVKFINTTLKNAPFCAVMLGQNLSDIYFNDLICENIGEHVFYKTGYIDINKNIENFICENIKLHNIGINPSNLTLGHTVQFIKIANVGDRTNVGYAKDIVLRNISLKQDDTYAFVNVFEIYDLRDSLADKVNGDFTSIYKCSKLDNVTCSNSKILRGFYTNASLISLNNIVFEQCVFTGHFPHVNFATTYKCCTFDKYMESSTTTALKNKILTFDNCIFNITASCSIDHVLTDIALINCSYKSKATTLVPSHMIGFGEKETIPSRLVTINGGYNDSVNFNFLFSFRHASLRVSLQNLIATGRIRTSVPIMNINMQNVFFNFDSGYYTPVLTDITATNTTFINVKTADGKSLDNYITGANGTFTDSAGKTITVINGVIKTIV